MARGSPARAARSPRATCVGTLLDRLCHRVEIVQIAGESWRLKESNERGATLAHCSPRMSSKGAAVTAGLAVFAETRLLAVCSAASRWQKRKESARIEPMQ